MSKKNNCTIPDFIIFGVGNYNSLGVLHALSSIEKKAFILLIGNGKDWKQGNIIEYSRFANHIQRVSNAEEGTEWLLKNQSRFPKSTIIYPTGDIEEKALDRRYDSLSRHFIIPNVGRKDGVSALMDKQIQMLLAKKAGIRILRSQYSNSKDFSFEKVEYPCMVKPLNSTAGSKGDMRVCENESELKKALATGKHTHEFIVQQYIRNEADLLFLGVSLPNGKVLIPALVKKPGVSPTGEYTHAIITTDVGKHLPESDAVIRFVKDIGYVGPFSIEFGLEKGKNYFFEINLRNDGTSHYPLNMSVNIPMLYYNGIKGTDVQSEFESAEYEMIDEVGDLRRVLGHELTLGQWLKCFRNAGAYRFYNSNDNNLIFPILKMFLSRTFSKIFRTLKR